MFMKLKTFMVKHAKDLMTMSDRICTDVILRILITRFCVDKQANVNINCIYCVCV